MKFAMRDGKMSLCVCVYVFDVMAKINDAKCKIIPSMTIFGWFSKSFQFRFQFNSHSAIFDSVVYPAIRMPHMPYSLCIDRPKQNGLFTIWQFIQDHQMRQLNGNQLGNFTFISVVKINVKTQRERENENSKTSILYSIQHFISLFN